LVGLPVAEIGARARGLTGEGRGEEREGERGGGEEMHCKRVWMCRASCMSVDVLVVVGR
jgi:hypothetical protein